VSASRGSACLRIAIGEGFQVIVESIIGVLHIPPNLDNLLIRYLCAGAFWILFGHCFMNEKEKREKLSLQT
jgi:hypothetical protein